LQRGVNWLRQTTILSHSQSIENGFIRVVREYNRNQYRRILLKEERKPILGQKSDKEDNPK